MEDALYTFLIQQGLATTTTIVGALVKLGVRTGSLERSLQERTEDLKKAEMEYKKQKELYEEGLALRPSFIDIYQDCRSLRSS